jgi:hypothetical protein
MVEMLIFGLSAEKNNKLTGALGAIKVVTKFVNPPYKM